MEAGGGGRAVKQLREGGGGGGGEEGGEGEQQSTTTIKWKPDERCLEMLLAMGIDRTAAIKGLYYTGNYSAEFAAAYVFDNPDLDEELDSIMRLATESPKEETIRSVRAHDSEDEAGETQHYKMAFVVNVSLRMGAGKIAIQVGHASIGLYRRLNAGGKKFARPLSVWEDEGEKKLVVQGEDDSHLMQLEKQAASADLETLIVRDIVGEEIQQEVVSLLGIFGREEIVNSVIEKLPSL